jgi:hypothetical protein
MLHTALLRPCSNTHPLVKWKLNIFFNEYISVEAGSLFVDRI